MCLVARLAVSRDRSLVLLAVANQGLHELQFIGQAYRWLKENRELTRKQKRFVAEYLADPGRNAVQACIRAGYAESTAYTAASDLLKHPKVRVAVEEEERRDSRNVR